MSRGRSLLFAGLGLVAACGQGISEDPLADIAAGGGDAGATGGGAPSSGGSGGAGGMVASTGGGGTSSSSDGGGSGAAGGSAGAGGSPGGAAGSWPEGLPTGSPECSAPGDCASGWCLLDETGVERCCEDDCAALGRVCSSAGQCVCRNPEAGGDCLLADGEACTNPEECASGVCAGGVCCNEACDGVCERCDAPDSLGTCSFFPDDARCSDQPGHQCSERGRCALRDGESCGMDGDCHSGHCEPDVSGGQVCCATECSGVCQKCGLDGSCDAAPLVDARCGPVTCKPDTACVQYEPPQPGACSASGQCAECRPVHAPGGVPCGAGSQCNGLAECRYTGFGQISAAGRHTCAIRDSGNVVCWGRNHAGQLGAAFDHPLVGVTESPAELTNLELDFTRDVVQVAAGFFHTCVLFDDGGVRCWGRVQDELTWGTVVSVLGTTDIAYTSDGFVDPLNTGNVRLREPAIQISAASGGAHTCALLRSGAVSCWGYNKNAQLGLGHQLELDLTTLETLPIVTLDAPALQVKAAAGHTCVVLAGGRVKCWGEGNLGRLGYGDNLMQRLPGPDVDVGGDVTEITTASGHTCALLTTGKIRCWGHNNEGQLGYGHTENIGDNETPAQAATLPGPAGRPVLGGDVPVGSDGVAVQITHIGDERSTCALFNTGSIRCWGSNKKGQLGYGHNDPGATERTPDELWLRPASNGRNWGGDVAIGGPARALADGGRCALRLDGQLFCWGGNEYGELGLPDHVPDGSLTLTPAEMGPVFWR